MKMFFKHNNEVTPLSGWRGNPQATNVPGDSMLWLLPTFLTLFGLVMVYSATFYVSEEKHASDWYYLVRQTGLVVLGFTALFGGMMVDVGVYRKYAKIAILGVIVLMILQSVFAPLIQSTRRWIPILGLTLQTSELARIVVIIFMARLLADDVSLGLQINRRLLKTLIPIGIVVVLTFLQRDLSGAAMIAALVALILFLAGLEKKQFWAVTGGVVGITLIAAMVIGYTRKRILGFINFFLNYDASSISDENYQSFQSMIGFGRGGIFGAGLGQGKQKMAFLPELHTDFIFSNVGEELGLWGAGAVLIAFVILYLKSLKILKLQTDRFSFLFGCGLIASLLMFALVHMAVTVGIIPVTGLPLPFISNGGSSLIISLWSMGVLWQLSRRVASFD